MSVGRYIRNFIIGKEQYVPSLGIYRHAMLRGQIALIALCVGLFYLITDSLFGIYGNLPLYGLVMSGGLISFLLNRNEYYQSSTIVLLLMGSVVVFILVANEGVSTGVHIFFIAINMASLMLFGYRRLWMAFIFIVLAFILFLIAFLVDLPPLGQMEFDPDYERMSIIVNFTASMIACSLGVYFIILNNYKSETALKGNQAKLFRISDELRRSQERLETAIKGSKAGIYEWHMEEDVIEVSHYWKELLGYQPDELNRLTWEEFTALMHPDDAARVSTIIPLLARNMQPYRNEIRFRTRSGAYKWFSDSGLARANSNGTPVMVVGSIVDISERKHAEAQIIHQNELLAKTNEELDRFVYSTSHDLRAPLSSLLGLITIAERTTDPAEIEKCLVMMRERVNTLDAFIREITDYSRNSRLEVALEPVPVYSLVKGIIENLKYLKDADKITVINAVPPDQLVVTDMGRLRVVLSNLLANAFKYHDVKKTNPFIKITSQQVTHSFVITVEDNGQGIAPDHQGKIFNMFYRASENSEGSGLGLYIVRETMEKLNGTISVQSVPEEGSSFIVTLPVR